MANAIMNKSEASDSDTDTDTNNPTAKQKIMASNSLVEQTATENSQPVDLAGLS